MEYLHHFHQAGKRTTVQYAGATKTMVSDATKIVHSVKITAKNQLICQENAVQFAY